MTQISLTFPDGNRRDYPAGVTPAQVAESIAPSLAKRAISAQVNGAHWDLAWPIEGDAQIVLRMGNRLVMKIRSSWSALRSRTNRDAVIAMTYRINHIRSAIRW